VGLDASNFFHQLNRFMCDSITSPSPFRVWTIEKFRLPFLKSLWSLKFDQINNSVFRQCLKMRKYIAPQFRPSVAKAIYELYNSRRILDFSAGWGDRLCAFHACKNTEFYFGVDPNRNVVSLYESQNELYNTNKKTFFVNEAFEDIDIPKKEFDTVFTSPPYFNLERYTTEENQSWVRYKKLDTWLNHFLFVSIEKSWRALKKKGYFIINISDVYSGHKINNICNPMLQRMKALDGAKLKDCIGIQMNVRPNSNIERKGTILVESIWIWQKS
jgi:16S rRNA G966 N2-methylase RsmD